ncbi:hypothetical protein PACTADRAFT_48172 [Pachysolen tannophilus NRRL Y-2460]|uniref:F-box domain-containing protein n=1 Tax=Pachysolen tannophilus NRRL Y-2460 TaxID=669874 RepID=A0A1E4U321_PACTA|nr:hypothetical protein PACTADRAFT_48172 [Pachysolen tannophilus NRRL Y-2460]
MVAVKKVKAVNFESLPDDIISKIIKRLAQQSKFQLLQTNYKLYTLVLPALYQNLLFKSDCNGFLADDYDCCKYTIVSGSSNILADKRLNDLIFKTRQDILLQSLKVNEEILPYVEKVVIFNYENVNVELANLLQAKSINLQTYLNFNNNFNLSFPNSFHSLTTCMINHCYELSKLPLSVKNLTINFQDSFKDEIKVVTDLAVDKDYCLKILFGLDSLYLSFDELSTLNFLKFIIEFLKPPNGKLFQFKSLKFIYYHGFNDYNLHLRNLMSDFLFKYVDLSILKSLEITMGCDYDLNCSCLTEFVDELSGLTNLKEKNSNFSTNLKILSFIEKTLHKDHSFIEKFDINLGRFIYNLDPKISSNLETLIIHHNPPTDGNIENNVEGNFLRRKKLYSKFLPILQNLKTLISPSFMNSCSCYEVITSELLWNGCRCEFCEVHLSIFDTFIMNHCYYDEATGLMKDVISPRFFSIAANYLNQRLLNYDNLEQNCSNLQCLSYPFFSKSWDFHNTGSKKTTKFEHHYEYDEDFVCKFNQSAFEALVKVMSHFMEAYVDNCVDLLPKLKTCILGGVFYKINSERKIINVFDDVGCEKNIIGPHDI